MEYKILLGYLAVIIEIVSCEFRREQKPLNHYLFHIKHEDRQ